MFVYESVRSQNVSLRSLCDGLPYVSLRSFSTYFIRQTDPKIVCLVKVTDEEIEEAFKMFDRDNSGSINHNKVK